MDILGLIQWRSNMKVPYPSKVALFLFCPPINRCFFIRQKSVSVGESLLSFEALCLFCVCVWKQLWFAWHHTC